MTAEEAVAKLKLCWEPEDKKWFDQEGAHIDADVILCDLLTELGYGEVVEAWEKVPKWYA